ncbi:phage tail protein [Pseudobacter ginsenosidimutans]|jgi:microcystin-dependent protein|uniref:Microcystin-dependent protein n=1 Tax=Pseudobacter ginsenosidimutans TaxID=661488 RepID=A0A4Q7N378_9BACT|nr:tail fiber protein [Pseudobacter ginsenosidimutans]QEC43551.1 phage tail protein [Pseudobacter ginsenosidimutans]RZS74945.1 microcystin-dependent protein [Pseudobacter ginsenosidimutans]
MQGTMAVVTMFASNFAPKNWAFCNGQILPISLNQALFSLLGTTYGGNGVTTFALPNLQGRVPIGTGNAPGMSAYVLGQAAGSPTTTLTLNNLPSHEHGAGTVPVAIDCDSNAASEQFPDGFYIAGLNNSFNISPTNGVSMQAPVYTALIGPAGNNQPIPLMPPYLTVNFIICLAGIFPSNS